VPPRVEYSVTPFGEQFIRVVDEIEKLQQAIDQKSDYRRQL
jgi:DNA-binding HxlR family transcriptional regulator